MAQAVVQDLQATIDHYLAYLFAEWRSVPDVAAEWSEWEEHERLDFVVEWPIREDRLSQLRRWAKDELLSLRQQEQFEDLELLVRRHRPLLERLLAE